MLLTPLARAYVFSAFAVLPAFIFAFAAFIPVLIIRRRAEQPWYERARYVYPFRQAIAALLGLELILWFVFCSDLQKRLNLENDPWFFPLACCGIILGTLYSIYLIQRRLGLGSPRFGRWLIEFSALLSVRLFVLVILVGVAYLLHDHLPPEAAWSIAWILGYALSVAGIGITILQRLRLITAASPQFHARIAELAREMQIEPPRDILVLQHRQANAFALPLQRKILITSQLLNELTSTEVDSIMAHELGHLTESRADLIKRIGYGMFIVPGFIVAVFNINNFLPLFCSILAIVLLHWWARGLSERLERRADKIAATTQSAPGEYAQALLKLYRCNLAPAVFRPKARRTHPDLFDRMVAAGTPPPFEKPKPPLRLLYYAPLCFALVLHTILFTATAILIPDDLIAGHIRRVRPSEQVIFDDQDDFEADPDEIPANATPI